MYRFTPGEAEVTAIVASTLKIIPGRGARHAVSFAPGAPRPH
jgi:hypothetical protein